MSGCFFIASSRASASSASSIAFNLAASLAAFSASILSYDEVSKHSRAADE